MKRWICIMLVFVCVCMLPCCGEPVPDSIEGYVLDYDEETEGFLIETDSGELYAFLITQDSQLLWETEELHQMHSQDGYTLFNYLAGCGGFTLTPGKRTPSDQNPFPEDTDNSFYLESATITEDYVNYRFSAALKPVIYLYPEEKTEVSVQLDYCGQLTCTYPAYRNGWNVTALPDGTLTDDAGQSYNYLYWEGESETQYDFSQGFCVPGSDTAAFLEDTLEQLGLTRREANEFIVYWLPLMEDNPYNLIAFQNEAYTSTAKLTISPAPDTLIRVFMAWKPLQEAVEIEPQSLTAPQRTGFTAVEWGGTQIG